MGKRCVTSVCQMCIKRCFKGVSSVCHKCVQGVQGGKGVEGVKKGKVVSQRMKRMTIGWVHPLSTWLPPHPRVGGRSLEKDPLGSTATTPTARDRCVLGRCVLGRCVLGRGAGWRGGLAPSTRGPRRTLNEPSQRLPWGLGWWR